MERLHCGILRFLTKGQGIVKVFFCAAGNTIYCGRLRHARIQGFLIVGALSWAAEGGVKVPLMATKQHPNASGTALISSENINIHAEGLKPNGVYTVWFVNMKPKKHEAGAGEPPYMFKTDSYGNGTYSARLKESPFGKWKMLMIVLHPTGDPKDMKNMVEGLSAKL